MSTETTRTPIPLYLGGDNAARQLTILQALSRQLCDAVDTPKQEPDIEHVRSLVFTLDELLQELEAS
jgi:hypothetical protein